MNLTLDVYFPIARSVPVPALKPAYILTHGGSNTGGNKEEFCLQGSAAFFVARGFVAFNINYRLAGDQGLLPPVNGPASGAPLVSYLARSGDDFWPHPSRREHGAPYIGSLALGENGTLCITAHNMSASSQLTLGTCVTGSVAQEWRLAHFDIYPQSIVHHASGLCLDIAGADHGPAAGLPIIIAVCNSSSALQQGWQLGTTGALITLNAAMSVSVDTQPPQEWTPTWPSGYPAVRDLKAAVRYAKAQIATFGVDPSRVALTGGSAGSTNSIAVGATFPEDYFGEISADEDSTLSTTHPELSSVVQAVVGHWSSDGEILLPQQHDPANRTRYSSANAPIIEFHGNNDTTIPIAHAYAVQAAYNRTGVPYELHVLEGCGHGAWCYNGKGNCADGCPRGGNSTDGYDPTMDIIAL